MSSSGPPLLFDRALGARRLARAHAQGFEPFLMARAAEDLTERLMTLSQTRRFEMAVDLASPVDLARQAMLASRRAGRVVRLVPQGAPLQPGDVAAEAEALPLGSASVDCVVSLLALHGINDLPGALAQIRQALKPDGLLMACLLGGSTLTELRQSLIAAEASLTGGASMRVAPFADLRDMGALLQRAGFALPVADVESVTVRYGDMFGLIRDLRAMGLTAALNERPQRAAPRALWMEAARHYAAHYADADGRIRATFEMVWLSGWAPHESQQKPLRPGSAKLRLAQALGVPEQSAGEKTSDKAGD
ncbi:MAG: methyltransferase domain-containing protein [Bosea sp. (in: a-proteobacteria)]